MDKSDAIKIASLISDLAGRTNTAVTENIRGINSLERSNPQIGVPLKDLLQVVALQTNVITQLGKLIIDDTIATGIGDDAERFLRDNDGTVQ